MTRFSTTAFLFTTLLMTTACATIEPPSRDERFTALTDRGGND